MVDSKPDSELLKKFDQFEYAPESEVGTVDFGAATAVARNEYDLVVIPRHRPMERCFVEDVRRDMTVDSPLDTAKNVSFRQHYEKVHGKVKKNVRKFVPRFNGAMLACLSLSSR